MKRLFLALLLGVTSSPSIGAFASAPPPTDTNATANGVSAPETDTKTIVKYRQAKEINFEQLIIEGQLKRPELSVVTGEEEQGTNGLLRLRENFVDRMTVDAGEENQ